MSTEMSDRQVNETAGKIAQMVHEAATKRKGAAPTASAIIECTVGALEPMIGGLFNGGTPQQRLLFSLILVGATATLEQHNEDTHGLTVDISPDTVREAMRLYMKITGQDIRHCLPTEMLKFADIGQNTLN